MNEARRGATVLVVEDNPGDVRLIREALDLPGPEWRMYTARDGEEALSFLRRREGFDDVPVPDLVLLDLNLPKRHGREVLAEIKADERLKSIPVVILSTSASEEDVREAYRLHANGYVTKPLDLDEFLRVGRAIRDFWLHTAQRPAA